jgi:hypothetical protein
MPKNFLFCVKFKAFYSEKSFYSKMLNLLFFKNKPPRQLDESILSNCKLQIFT